MILSFRNRALKRFWEASDGRGLNAQHLRKIELILDLLENATKPEMMNLAKLKFHKLSGENPPRWSVWVNGNWRVTFSFEGENAVAVDYEDYH
jgi:proteic killer suppression protein